MIDIPDEIRIKATIRQGTVYYFPEDTFSSNEPHYFIVLNHGSNTTDLIILVCSSSQIEKTEKRVALRGLPIETAVKIKETDYAGFTKDSIIDCNTVLQKNIDQIVEKLRNGELKIKPDMPKNIVEKLIDAVRKSPMVTQEVKSLLE